ncbi:hypothetical protein OUZ56_018591 [Daphnia magna]|uniref:Uncharacterized protein n=1 Tax=Daphnia magna TaxID=35525 RepID=A0ABQ9Z983_9CRUS|nr:hypothetical protein OUZ56_018591 [Daphnia magna]
MVTNSLSCLIDIAVTEIIGNFLFPETTKKFVSQMSSVKPSKEKVLNSDSEQLLSSESTSD